MRNVEEIIDVLDKFAPEGDFLTLLNKLTDELLNHPNLETALPAMLKIFEKFPEEELGSPGPLVHAIEKCPGYERLLLESLKRQPGTMSVWMVHRLLKYDPQPEYIEALRDVLSNPKASEQTKEDASLLLSWIDKV